MLEKLPFRNFEITSIEVYKELASANRALAELKGFAQSIPNQHILINAMTLNEAKDSSEIEQIVTTHDELYEAMSVKNNGSLASKEVLNYRNAIWRGYEFISDNGFIHTNLIVEMQQLIEPDKNGIRKLPGTAIRNSTTGEIVYTPPQNEAEIRDLLSNLDMYMNENMEFDPLIQLAIIHYQFESIHPFYDGNGRSGRILNVLYLVLKDLITSPIIYLSKYILRTKTEYYQLLKNMQSGSEKAREDWIIYFLRGIQETSSETLEIVKQIINEMESYQFDLKERLPKLYSKELVESLFFEFYTRVSYLEESLGVSRRTATTYLKQLEEAGFLSSEMKGRYRIYKNDRLFRIIEESNKN